MARRGRSRALLWLVIPAAVVAVLLAAAVTYVRMAGSAATPRATAHTAQLRPADLFIQSIVKDDGALGWHQLCPGLQAQIPQAALVQQANAQRTAAAQRGLKLSSDFIGARRQPSGGELRVYVLTAHWPNGTTQQRTYSVLTQTSGCVEDVTNQ
jgi:hypothetical protein